MVVPIWRLKSAGTGTVLLIVSLSFNLSPGLLLERRPLYNQSGRFISETKRYAGKVSDVTSVFKASIQTKGL